MELQPLSGEKSKKIVIGSDTVCREESAYRWLSKRYLLACTMFMGSFVLFSFASNVSIALIEMTKNRTILINETVHYLEPEFEWNSKIKGLILSMGSYGRLLSPIGAFSVKKFGGVRTYGVGVFLCGAINILHPFTVRFNFYLFLAARFIEGASDIAVYISVFDIWSKWAPEGERSKLMAIGFTGLYVGTAVIFPLSGFLAYFWQWPSTFHFIGGLAVLVSLILLLFFSNDPSTDKYISEEERKYILQEVKISTQDKVTYPWKQIFTSKSIWALIVGIFCFNAGYKFLAVCLPLYVKDLTNMQIQSVGIISGIPNFTSIVTIPLGGFLADYLQNKNILRTTQVHKMYIFIGLVLAGVCLGAVTIQPNFTIKIILLIFYKILLSLSYLALLLVPLYMAPNHASLVAAVISYGIVAGGVFTPILMGYVVTSHDPLQWSIFLACLAFISLAGGIVFLLFGSSEVQPWSRTRTEQDQELNTEKLL